MNSDENIALKMSDLYGFTRNVSIDKYNSKYFPSVRTTLMLDTEIIEFRKFVDEFSPKDFSVYFHFAYFFILC